MPPDDLRCSCCRERVEQCGPLTCFVIEEQPRELCSGCSADVLDYFLQHLNLRSVLRCFDEAMEETQKARREEIR